VSETPPIEEGTPQGIVVCLSGALTGDGAHDWEVLVHRIWAAGPHPVSLDLSAVSLLTCSAVHAIVRVAAGARHRGLSLQLHRVPPQACRLLHWAHLGHLVVSRSGPSPEPVGAAPPVVPSDGPRSWAGLPRTTTTAHGPISTEELQTALHRAAIGDAQLERAITDLACAGPSLLRWLTAGLITVEPDVDDTGGGWWAEIAWADLDAAMTSRLVAVTRAETVRVQQAVIASGRLL